MESVQHIIRLEWTLLFGLLIVIALAILGIVVWYHSTTYFKMTKHPVFSVLPHMFKKEEQLSADKLGRYGEFLISLQLRPYEKQGAKLLFNTYIPKEDGTTTEIDVMMVCPKGIFVFESKNYSGWIFGKESEKNWCQTLPKGKGQSSKKFFYNPMRQNAAHIKHLAAFLGEDILTQSVIVFSNRCKLKKLTITGDIPVVNRHDVRLAVAKMYQTLPDSLSGEAVATLYAKLYPCTQVTAEAEAQHVKQLHAGKKQVPEQPKPEAQTCPKCGGKLILRTAKRGEKAGTKFYGCENFPKCRYIKEL